ncbi:MAG: serine--tRNA ligase [Verrucomicrobia bacterium]|nr:serine--tRNA ligase [Verrucomicrobiota bacterium]
MLGIKEIVKNKEEIEKRLRTKDPSISLDTVTTLYEDVCKRKTQLEALQSEANRISKEIGEKKQKGLDAGVEFDKVASLKKEIHTLSSALPPIEKDFEYALSLLPNIPDKEIKVSLEPKDNVCIKTVGHKREFSFAPKNHLELGESLGLFDFKRGAKITGSGWPIYTALGARLEWALLNLMIESNQANGFTFLMLPHLVRSDIMYASGQLPKFGSQLFKLDDEDYPLYLIPTAEVAINGLHYDEILDKKELPKLYCSYTPCFRREAGGAGKNERGLIRIHQFNKVELFAFTTPEESDAIFEKILTSAEAILEKLELHYRNMLLVTGDMSFGASRTVDIEVFLPGQERYYEVSSVSNCRDFQARRSKTRFRDDEDKKEFVHTLNGSGLATSRLMVSLLENNQNEDGTVTLPKALHKALGQTTLSPKK